MTPLDTVESISTFPFSVSYKATDGLGLLQDRSPLGKVSEDAITPFTTVLAGLYETGLNLPVYVDSRIYEGSNDGLISATSSANSFYDDNKLINRITYKEAIEGYLAAFNCKIYQSNAAWYITNASTHGGTTDVASFKRYEIVSGGTGYTVTTDSPDENLRYSLNGSDTRDLIPAKDDLTLNIRRPLGSVECQPENLIEIEIADNGTFENVLSGTSIPTGWTVDPASLEQTLTTSSAIRLEGQRSLTTSRNVKDYGELADIWFVNEVGYDIDQSTPFTVNFDWLGQILDSSEVRNVKVSYQLYYETDNTFITSRLNLARTLIGPLIPSYDFATTNRLIYDFVTNSWQTPFFELKDGRNLSDLYRTFEADGNDLNKWLNDSAMISSIASYYDEEQASEFTIPPGKLYIRVFYPRGNRTKGDGINGYRDTSASYLTAYVDNISIRNNFGSDILQPTLERVQTNYNETQTYTPRFASGISDVLTQKLSPTDTYFREGKTESVTLERIVTQQKLNDYRGGNTTDPLQSSLKYYEGTVINNTAIPLAPKNKVDINYANYDETASCIFNGGTFKVKENEFKIAMYVPNQATDIAAGDGDTSISPLPAGFYEENVDLIAQSFPGRSENVVYTLGIDITTTNSVDGADVENGLVPIVQGETRYIQFIGPAGSMVSTNLLFTPIAGFIANAAGSDVRTPTTDEPLPEFTTFGDFTYLNGSLALPLEIMMPPASEYEIIRIDGSVSPFVPEETPAVVPTTVVIDWSSDLIAENSLVPSSSTAPSYRTIFNTDGIPGSVVHFTYIVEARSAGNAGNGWHLFAENFSISENDTSLENLDARQVGERTIAIDFEYTIPTTTESVPVTLIGAASDPSSIDNPTFDYNVTFDTSGSNFTLFETNNVFKGTEGSVVPYNLLVNPNEGYDLRAGAFTYSSTTAGAINNLPSGISIRSNTSTGFIQNGEEVVLPINVRIGDANTSGEITITGTPVEEPYSLTFLVNDVGSEGWSIDNSQKIQPYGTTDFDNSIPTFTFYVTPNANMEFTDGDQAHIDNQVMADVDETSIGLPESQFTITRTYDAGKIKCVVAGKFPVLTNLPNFPHHATVSINITGSAGVGRSTVASFAVDEITIPLTGGLPKVAFQSNGRVSVEASQSATDNVPVDGGWLLDGNVTYTNNGNGNGSVGHNGAVVSTTSSRTAYWLLYPETETTGTPLDSIKVTQEDPSAAGVDTTGYSLTGIAIGGQFLGFATYTDGQGTERIVATSTEQTIYFCSNTVPNALAGTVAASSVPTCSRGTVSGGQSYADEAGDSAAIAGSTVVYTNIAPTTASDDGIYFIAQ